MKSVVAVLAVVAVGAGAVVVSNSGNDDAGDAPGMATSNDMAPVEVRTFDITTVASGELEARNQIEIRSELEQRSTITFVVPEGSRVTQGETLVTLNTDAIETNIEEETLRVESARNDVAAAETAHRIQQSTNDSNLRAANLNLELKTLALQQWKAGDVKKRRQQLQLAVEQADRQLERLQEKFERSEQLLGQGFLSKNERDIDEINYIEALAKLETTRLDQEIYEEYQHPRDERSKKSDVEEAEANLERVTEENEINLKNKLATLETRRRQLDLRKQKLEKLYAQLDAAKIVAPSDGLVVYASSLESGRRWGGDDGPLQIGKQVNTNELLIVLPDTNEMMASVRVHESLAGRVRPGQPAEIEIEAAGGGSFKGTVESIGVLAETGGWRDPNRREYTVRVALDADDRATDLKPSMRCEATLRLGRVEDAITAPIQAIFSDGAVRYVYTAKGSKYERVPVRIGRRSAIFAEILAGVDVGDAVLLREPSPGEVLGTAFTEEQLASVGFKYSETGQIVAMQPAGRPSGRPGAGRPSGGRPAGVSTGAGKPSTAPAGASKPAAAAAKSNVVPATTQPTGE
ncbi:MAG: HlyD family efflux transporter periplasmic adaptor subunit [Planctomycetota bacterium]